MHIGKVMRTALLWLGVVAFGAPVAATESDRSEIAEQFMRALEHGDYVAAHDRFDATAAAGVTEDELRAIWESLPKQLGALRERGPARVDIIAGRPTTVYPLRFETMVLDARVSVDDAGRVDGFRLLPAETPPPAPQAGRWQELPIVVAGDLPGLLTVPEGSGPFAAVVLVHGSGPNDRDQRLAGNLPFRDLAHGLAERGVASLRYDKRTRAHPMQFTDSFTVEEEVLADALAAIALLRPRAEVDAGRVFLVGHSLGGLLAPRIAARAEGLAGAVLLAAPARGLHELVPAQMRYIAGLDGEIDDNEARRIARVEAEAAAVLALTEADLDEKGMLGLPNRYLMDLRDHDPLAAARSLSIPLLLMQGGRDYQATEAEDFALWRQALAGSDRATFKLYPNLNHLFMPGEGMATPREYVQEAKRVDPAMIDDLAAWIANPRP